MTGASARNTSSLSSWSSNHLSRRTRIGSPPVAWPYSGRARISAVSLWTAGSERSGNGRSPCDGGGGRARLPLSADLPGEEVEIELLDATAPIEIIDRQHHGAVGACDG